MDSPQEEQHGPPRGATWTPKRRNMDHTKRSNMDHTKRSNIDPTKRSNMDPTNINDRRV